MIASLIQRISTLEPAPPWSLFAAVNTVFVSLVAVIAGSLLALTLLDGQAFDTLVAWLIGLTLTIAYVWASRREPEDRAALRLSETRSRLLIVLLFSLGMAIAIDALVMVASGQFLPAAELISFYGTSPGILSWILAWILMLIVQPIAEELVFRGVFYPTARHLMGAWGGFIMCVLVYAIFHYVAYSSPFTPVWYALVAPLLSGLVITGVRANSGSTRAAIIAHMGFGLFALLKLFVLPG
jgi:membrane protease YdiL (CAAX protease family)